jgi:hypothetical protein
MSKGGEKVIAPFGKNIVAKMIIRDKIGGIVIPDIVKDPKANFQIELEVVACGSEVTLKLKPGDKIVCGVIYFVPMSTFLGVEKGMGTIKEEFVTGVIM